MGNAKFAGSLMLLASSVAYSQVCGPPTGTALSFTGAGNYTLPPRPTAIQLAPFGGTPPYTFSVAAGSEPWPGFQVTNYPNVPTWFPYTTPGAIHGESPANVLPSVPYSTTIELRDCAGAVVKQVATATFTNLDFAFQYMPLLSERQTVSIPLTGVGGTPPYTISLVSGKLPPGLAINPDNSLGGTVEAGSSGNYNFTLKIADTAGSSLEQGFGITVVPLNVNMPSRYFADAKYNQPYSKQILVEGGTPPYTFALVRNTYLPSGLTLSSSGLLSGTPTYNVSTWDFYVSVTDSSPTPITQSFGFSIAITTNTPLPLYSFTSTFWDATRGNNTFNYIYPYGGLPPYTCSVSAGSSLPEGIQVVSYGELDEQYSPAPCYLIGDPLLGKGETNFSIHVTDSVGNSTDLPVTWNISPIGIWNLYLPSAQNPAVLNKAYSQPMLPFGGTPPYFTRPHYSYPVGLNIPEKDQFATLSGTPLESGNDLSLSPTVSDSAGNHFTSYGGIAISAGTGLTPLTITSGYFAGTVGSLFEGYLGVFTYNNGTQNPPYKITLFPNPFGPNPNSNALPPGLSLIAPLPDFDLDQNTYAGLIAGFPTQAGTWSYLLNIQDAKGNIGQRAITIQISNPSPPPVQILNPYTLQDGEVGTKYSQQIYAAGGSPPYTFSLDPNYGVLPPGLALNSSGIVSGIPTKAGSYSFCVYVGDSTNTSTEYCFNLNIDPFDILGPTILPTSVESYPYSYQFTLDHSSGTLLWSTNYGTYPIDGLSLNSKTGLFSGIPSSGEGASTFQVSVGNGTATSERIFVLPEETLASKNLFYLYPLGTYSAQMGYLSSSPIYGYGGVPPYSATVASGTLPPGMALINPGDKLYQAYNLFNYYSGVGPFLYGVPTAQGKFSFTVNVTDSIGQLATEPITINTVAQNQLIQPTVLNSELPNASYNVPYSAEFRVVGGTPPYTFTVQSEPYYEYDYGTLYGRIPAGLSISKSGLINGTPLETGYYYVLLNVCDSNGVCTTSYVNGNVYSNPTTDIGVDAYLESANIPAVGHNAQIYVDVYRYSNTLSYPLTWTLLSGSFPPGMVLNATPTSYCDALLTGVPTAAGTYTAFLKVQDSSGNFGVGQLQILVRSLFLAPQNDWGDLTTDPPPGQVDAPYRFTLSASNGTPPYTFSLVQGSIMPPGLTLSADGVISGTPTSVIQGYPEVTVTDSTGATTQQYFYLPIYPAAQTGVDGDGYLALPSATVGAPYSLALTNLLYPGFGTPPISFALETGSSLPAGLSIVPPAAGSPATISGTPTSSGSSSFNLVVTDASGNQAVLYDYSLAVTTVGISPAAGDLPPATLGMAYSQPLTAFGGVAPYKFSLASNSDLPVGLTLSQNGILGGVATSAGKFVLYVNATDSQNSTALQRYTITVGPAGVVPPNVTVEPGSIDIEYTIGDPAPAPIPVSVGSSGSPLGFSAAVAGGNWLSVSASGPTTPGTATLTITPGKLAAGTYQASLSITAPASANSPVTVPITINVSKTPPPCTYFLLSPVTYDAGGGNENFPVATQAGCNWSVSGISAPWITATGATSFTGSASFAFSLATNSSPNPRSTTLSVAGQSVTINQLGAACGYSLGPAIPAIVPATNQATSLSIIGGGCSWTASSTQPWVTFNPASGSTSANTTMTIAQNDSGGQRQATLTIAGQQTVVTQPPVSCTYSLASANLSASSAGGPTQILLTASAPSCIWNAATAETWVTLPGTASSGTGNLSMNLAANSTTQPRQGSVSINGQPLLTVMQAGVSCDISLAANNPIQPSTGGQLSIQIQTTGNACSWTASSNANWVTLSRGSPSSGVGSATVAFDVAATNSATGRQTTVQMAGQTLTVNQSGTTCGYQLQSPGSNMSAEGGNTAVGVLTANAPSCTWTGNSNASWIHVLAPNQFTGAAELAFSVDSNAGSKSSRQGTLTIAGQNYAVTQAAGACPVVINTPPYSATEQGGVSSFSYTTSDSTCVPTLQSYASWLVIQNSTQNGTSGTIMFSVDPNGYNSGRSSSITANGTVFAVNQAANTCGYTVPPSPNTFSGQGGSGSLALTASSNSCPAPPVSVIDFYDDIVVLGLESGPAPDFLQPYSVNPYVSFIPFIRTAELDIAGQILKIKQHSY